MDASAVIDDWSVARLDSALIGGWTVGGLDGWAGDVRLDALDHLVVADLVHVEFQLALVAFLGADELLHTRMGQQTKRLRCETCNR